jgi:hypothetical protein
LEDEKAKFLFDPSWLSTNMEEKAVAELKTE